MASKNQIWMQWVSVKKQKLQKVERGLIKIGIEGRNLSLAKYCNLPPLLLSEDFPKVMIPLNRGKQCHFSKLHFFRILAPLWHHDDLGDIVNFTRSREEWLDFVNFQHDCIRDGVYIHCTYVKYYRVCAEKNCTQILGVFGLLVVWFASQFAKIQLYIVYTLYPSQKFANVVQIQL